MTKNDRLRELRKKRGMSQQQVAELIDSQQPYISKLEKKEEFSYEQAKRLAEILDSTADYIYYGTRNENITNKTSYGVSENAIIPMKSKGKITSTNTGRRNENALIPFYNADFMAGNSEVFYEDGTIYPEYYMDVPEFTGCTAFRAYSDSMEPKIRAGNILFGKKAEDWWLHLEYGQIYGITCNDGRRYLKYIRRHQDPQNYFILRSENKDYDDFDMPKDKIKNIWLIEGWLDKRT